MNHFEFGNSTIINREELVLRLIRKRNLTVAIIIILTLYAFVDSAIYYYPSYAYKGLDRDFYSSKGYYVTITLLM